MKNIKILKKSSKYDCQNTTQEKQTLPIASKAEFIFVATTASVYDRGGDMNSGGGGINDMGGNAGRVQWRWATFNNTLDRELCRIMNTSHTLSMVYKECMIWKTRSIPHFFRILIVFISYFPPKIHIPCEFPSLLSQRLEASLIFFRILLDFIPNFFENSTRRPL